MQVDAKNKMFWKKKLLIWSKSTPDGVKYSNFSCFIWVRRKINMWVDKKQIFQNKSIQECNLLMFIEVIFFTKTSNFTPVYFSSINLWKGDVHLWIYGFQEFLASFIIFLKV